MSCACPGPMRNQYGLQEVVNRSIPKAPFQEVRAIVAGAPSYLGFSVVQQLINEGIPVKAFVQDPSDEVTDT